MITYSEKPYKPEQIRHILNPIIDKWFFTRFKEFSLPQLFGVMEIHSRNNILVSAPTGATKTLTAFLSILNELIDSSEKGILENRVYCVYVSPLKALSNDIQVNLVEPLKEMEKIAGKKLGIRVGVRTGDTSASERAKMLKHPPHILITTPESLAIMLSSIKFSELLKNVEWFIADEVHALAENKRGVYLSLSMERLNRISPSMTRIGLSATIAPLEEIAKYLAGYEKGQLRNCKIVDVQFIKNMDLEVLSPVPDLVGEEHAIMHSSMYILIDNLIQSHKTTLIFTNTRSATERVVHHLKEKFPKNYTENIGAHHGSLSKTLRHSIESRLRKGELKVIVSSTSLELGIDIGYIDLVICLGSPKSVARFLQRAGRSGHKLHDTVKARIIVLDRDDLVECAVLLKSAIEKKIDKIHIPKNCLDVLAQQIHGMSLEQRWNINELFNLVKQSYCYHDLEHKDFIEIIEYLSGKYASLEDRHIYAKIWYDEETGELGKKGKMSRVIYMTNIGTIPEESHVIVKVGEQAIGTIDEAFLERMKRGDVFVLGGERYEFLYAKGMVAYVNASVFRKLMNEMFCANKPKNEIMDFINSFLYVDKNAAESVYDYFYEQFNYAEIPSHSRIIVENYSDDKSKRKYYIFHTLYGRRVNDCLSRAVAFAIAKTQHRDVEIGINDNGFYVGSDKSVNVMQALALVKSKELRKVMDMAIEHTEVLRRRFRHCASRAMMILRSYKGHEKRVGRQQVSSMILLSAVKRINPDFCILKEARREVLEDLMDIENTIKVIEGIEQKKILIKEIKTSLPSPFAFNLILQGFTDIMKIEDKVEFLRRMHQQVMAKIKVAK
ncbi:DEAD/DEAH box helicase [Candidatus Woesearchaeota archaeon]|nr:DEAD/DEAH box helicase [Candidatus Woesearchaeota archaeon]